LFVLLVVVPKILWGWFCTVERGRVFSVDKRSVLIYAFGLLLCAILVVSQPPSFENQLLLCGMVYRLCFLLADFFHIRGCSEDCIMCLSLVLCYKRAVTSFHCHPTEMNLTCLKCLHAKAAYMGSYMRIVET
jgi:hypothetical protein